MENGCGACGMFMQINPAADFGCRALGSIRILVEGVGVVHLI